MAVKFPVIGTLGLVRQNVVQVILELEVSHSKTEFLKIVGEVHMIPKIEDFIYAEIHESFYTKIEDSPVKFIQNILKNQVQQKRSQRPLALDLHDLCTRELGVPVLVDLGQLRLLLVPPTQGLVFQGFHRNSIVVDSGVRV